MNFFIIDTKLKYSRQLMVVKAMTLLSVIRNI